MNLRAELIFKLAQCVMRESLANIGDYEMHRIGLEEKLQAAIEEYINANARAATE